MTEADRSRPALLAPFRHRLFLVVWLAMLLSNCGGQIQSVGASWAMNEMTGSPQLVALVATASLLPVLIFALPFGAAADVFDRRKVLLVAQLIMLAASAALAAISFAGLLGPSLLLFLTFVLGCGFALNIPAWQAAVGAMVPRADMPAAISLNTIGFNLARTAAPALGGLIVAIGGAQSAFAVNAITYVGLLLVLFGWRGERRESKVARETLAGAVVGGLSYVLNARGVGRIILRGALFGLCLTPLMALAPMVVSDLLGGDARLFGIMLGWAGAGAVGGALVAGRLRDRLGAEGTVQLAQATVIAALLLTSFSRTPVLTGLAQLLAGTGMVLALTGFNIVMQLSVPRWVVGRALSVYQMGTFGGLSVGAWMWGAVAEVTGIPLALQLAALVMAAAVLLGLRLPLLEPDAELLRPSSLEFSRELPIAGERTPVSVLREYRIGAGQQGEFLALMRERRRLMRRQGVRQWSLAQDADDPELWIERYQRSSWDEFLRSRERVTVEEERMLDQLGALHQGGGRPLTRFLVEQDVTSLPLARAEVEF